MKITKEDRIRIFGSYIGSEIIWISEGGVPYVRKSTLKQLSRIAQLDNFDEWSILVTPLEKTPIEIKMEVAKVFFGKDANDFHAKVCFSRLGNTDPLGREIKYFGYEHLKVLEAYEVLRKNSITAPFGPYPVEQLVQEGIFKLREI